MRRKPTTYGFHPCCELFPLLSAEGRARLAADIKANGLRNKITLFDKKTILDGRNRYLACGVAKVKPEFVEWDGKGTPLEFVLGQNLQRRQLSSSQRAVLALDLLPHLKHEAKARQRNGRQKVDDRGKATEAAAKKAGTNHEYVSAVLKIGGSEALEMVGSAPKLLDLIRDGDLKVREAKSINAVLMKLPEEKKEEILKTCGQGIESLREAIKAAKPDRSVKPVKPAKPMTLAPGTVVGDLALLEEEPADSVRLALITGSDYNGITKAAAVNLRDGGLCLVYCDPSELPAAITAMEAHLTYWHCFGVQVGDTWKCVLAFAKLQAKTAPGWGDRLLAEDELVERLTQWAKRIGAGEWCDDTHNCINGCSNGCLYCFARLNYKRRNYARLTGWPRIWTQPLLNKRPVAWPKQEDKLIMFPSTHDLEPKFLGPCIARIKDLIGRGHKLIVVTKPRLETIRRLCAELETLKQSFAFWFTIGSSDDKILRYWEPSAPPFKERFESLKLAFRKGFTTSVSCEPCLDTSGVTKLFHQVEPFVRDKIWIGTMNNLDGKNGVKAENQGHPGFDAEIRRIEEGQMPPTLLDIHAALKNEPKVMWKGDFLALMRGEDCRHGRRRVSRRAVSIGPVAGSTM